MTEDDSFKVELEEGREFTFWSHDGYTMDFPVTAMSIQVSMDHCPGWYRRTFAVGIVLGWFAAAIAGLFDYDTWSWEWSRSAGFKAFRFEKRKRVP
ncbi:hypothetical protein [Sphingobium yanoikuyae]|uniref:hypothetical protein n=1 Tax=Sphingobium yanoikuyae TaxID=13690 RepID=UPI0035C79437